MIFIISLFFIIGSAKCSKDSYDYVIVGGGTAGTILANRLSADPSIEVLLLEAGEWPSLITEVPLLLKKLLRSEYDWNYATVPQKFSCFGLKEYRSVWPRGKAVGGSSSINGMGYFRGNKNDYDDWAAKGATGWNWDNVLPYFLKSEDNKDLDVLLNGYHKKGGNIVVQRPPFRTPGVQYYMSAAEELGYGPGDFNGPNQTSFMIPQATMKNGRRWSPVHGYIYPIKGRRNLQIITSAFVTKILFDNSKRAYGVEFHHNNVSRTAKASKEVILSAGSISSPHLLMLSGIGPSMQLNRLRIPIIADLPVGKNLQDHVTTVMLFTINKPYTLKDERIQKKDYEDFITTGKGPLTSPSVVEVAGYINTKYNKKLDWPDMEIYIGQLSGSEGAEEANDGGYYKTEVYNKMFAPYLKNDTIQCSPLTMRPLSRGEITLASANPYDRPIIDPNYYSHPVDIDIMVEGMKFCLKWASTKSMQEIGARPTDPVVPGCETFIPFNNQYLACAARVMTETFMHLIGTCKMGDPKDISTVVDPHLRVKGVRGLRVADASIMPTMISGHTYAPTMMIAEKASDMILQEHYSVKN